MKYITNITTDNFCFNTRKEAQDWISNLPNYLIKQTSIIIKENWYIAWYDNVNGGFVDYAEDFVSDDLEDRAMWFETEAEAEEYIEKIKEKNPLCCELRAVEYIDEDF